ncbi:UDP-N-acetylmuramoyl-L-alanyl-D-glutamate--2,6-diaminopimelate ligase [Oceanipulchritudo coccoides]|uniref:UDP-N-acetylmuramoyl-L-alanyl-D-glutamate--2, 6-diaminopimelate ligase n=1 Tax=Oceanipulchritudo coccoides TaxID=2706888 RepID=UPI001EE9AAC4|nr:UDP-N-acetylmuramoyl-L-alanyl-D-glutamate--2,6-diaminopimelate ligase [Oceanipulchritudo coccoides]
MIDTEIRGVACHPDEVQGPGYLFVCMDEYLEYNRWFTWRAFLEKLPSMELAGVVSPSPVEGLSVPQLITPFPRKALGQAARLFLGNPDEGVQFLGVTGTNGKTTTTRLLAHLNNKLGIPCGSIGTLGIALGDSLNAAGTYTTPLSPELYRHLLTFRESGARAVSMEVSSHALTLDRVEGLLFDGAVLTNVERDHLDFHGTQEAYAMAKQGLFNLLKPGGVSVLNRASAFYNQFAEAAGGRVVSFGMENSGADYEVRNLILTPQRSRFSMAVGNETCPFESHLVGDFQVENVAAAVALMHAMGHSLEALADALKDFPPVCGRMEQIFLPNGCTAIVDYAHNPDGLQHVLKACRPFCERKLHVAFGCGGDRDRGKRSIMGSIAAELADVCWVTSDNPRTEDPEAIINDIMEGVQSSLSLASGSPEVHQVPDREEALRTAYNHTKEGDLLVVAGKGHEDYQIIGLTKHPFSDQAILRSFS